MEGGKSASPRSLFLADDRVGGDDFSPSAHKWGIGGGFHLLPAAVTFWDDFPLESFSKRGKEVKEIGEIRAISKGTLLHPSWPAAAREERGRRRRLLGRQKEREEGGDHSLLSYRQGLSFPLLFPVCLVSPSPSFPQRRGRLIRSLFPPLPPPSLPGHPPHVCWPRRKKEGERGGQTDSGDHFAHDAGLYICISSP